MRVRHFAFLALVSSSPLCLAQNSIDEFLSGDFSPQIEVLAQPEVGPFAGSGQTTTEIIESVLKSVQGTTPDTTPVTNFPMRVTPIPTPGSTVTAPGSTVTAPASSPRPGISSTIPAPSRTAPATVSTPNAASQTFKTQAVGQSAKPSSLPFVSGEKSKEVKQLLDFEFKLAPVELDINEDLILAKEHYEAGRWQQAVAAATEFLRLNPGHKQTANALFLRGESNVQLQRYRQVMDDFGELLNSKPNRTQQIRAEFRLAESSLLLEQFDDAKQRLEAFRQQYPNDNLNAYAITYLAEVIARDNTPWAKAIFVESLQRYPFGPLSQRARLRLALIRFKEGSYQSARSDLEQLVESGKRNTPEFWTAWYWLGRCEHELNEKTAATKRFLTLIEENPNHELAAAAAFQSAELSRDQEEFETAVAMYSRIRRDWPSSPFTSAASLGLMQIHKQQGNDDLAMQLYREPNRFASEETQMLATQIAAEILLSKKQFLEVENAIRPYTEEQPSLGNEEQRTSYYRNIYLLGLALRGQGKYAMASELLGRIRTDLVSPEMGELTNLARVETFVAAEEYDRANQEALFFEGRLPKSKRLPALREQMIRSFALSNRLDEAFVKFKQLQRTPNANSYLARTAGLLAETAYQKGDYEKARLAFYTLEQNQQSDDEMAQAMSGLAWIEFKQKNYAEAAQRFEVYSEARPRDPNIWQMRLAHAKCLVELERKTQAVSVLQPFESLDNDHPLRPRGMFQLAELLNEDPNRRAEAANLMAKLLEDHPDFEYRDAALYFAGMYGRRKGDPAGHAKLNELVEEHTSSRFWSDALYRLAESAHAQRDHSAANEYLTKLISAKRDVDVMPHALFMKGRLESDAKQWLQARDTLRQLLRDFPSSKLVPVARYGVAESFFQEKEFQRAHQLFQILNQEKRFKPGDSWGAMVQLRLAQLEVHRKNLLEAAQIAENIRSTYPNFPLQHEADYLVGRVAAARGEFSQARSAYDRVVTEDSTFEREISAMAQWMIGETYFHQKKYILAIKAYEALVADLKFENWQAASHLQIGKCYELLDNPAEAEKSYRRVTTEYGTSKWAKEAQERLSELRQSV